MIAPALAALLLAVAVVVRPGADAVSTARLAALAATGPGATGPPVSPVLRRWRERLRPHALPLGAATAVALLAAVAAHGVAAFLAPVALGAATFLVGRRVLRRTAREPPADPLGLAGGWDLLAACLRGGLPVSTAVRAVAADLPVRAADALRGTADLLALGADPVAAWEPALREPLTADLARGARRSARSGAALAGVAERLAAGVRADADELAEARAQRVAVAVTGPLGLCFLPAFLCLGVVPVVIGLATRVVANW